MKKRMTILLSGSIFILLIYFLHSVYSISKPLIQYQTQYKAMEIIHNAVIEEMELSENILKGAVELQYSQDGKITAVVTDAYLFSVIKEHLTNRLLKEFSDVNLCRTNIPLFSILGIPFLSQSGPDIPFCIGVIGVPKSEIKGTLSSFGINQNLYQITLSYKAKVSALFPFYSINTDITDQIILYEIVFVGEVPGVILDQK